MITAFKQYLLTLKLSPVSRKLYLSDIRRFLSTFGSEPTLDQLTSTNTYTRYLDSLHLQAMAPSMLKRTLASLRQLGIFLSLTYSLPNPLLSLSTTPKLPLDNYIKHFTKYLESQHLSPLTIKSYKSDMTRYLDWATTNLPSTQTKELLINKNIKKYLNHLADSASTLPSTIERKSKSIARFGTWYGQVYAKTSISDNNLNTEKVPSLPHHSQSEGLSDSVSISSDFVTNTSPDQSSFFVKTFNYRTALAFAILLLFAAALGIFGYRQFTRDANLAAAYPSTPTPPNRQLSFQGRLENAAGTPIVGPTNMVFKLWNALSAGTELYSTGTCSISSDSDGVFSTQIGSSCGSAIPSSVFTENINVWLEVTVVSEVLAPRQPISSVAYALNSETLQGLPIGTTSSTVPYINNANTISLTETSPKLTGTTGTLQISAPSLSFITAVGSNGNITFAPDGTGQVNVNGNTTSTNFFNVSNAQLTTGSLITGVAANNNAGFKLIDLSSGSSPTSKFSVSALGNTIVGGDLTVTGDDLYMATNTSGNILVADGTNYNPVAVSGDVTINSSGATTIGADKITEGLLKSVNAPTDEMCLSYESTVGDFEWQTCGSSGSSSFSDITSGTNTTAAMVVGTGSTLGFSGSGTINASSLLGNTWAAPGAIGSTTPSSGAFTTLSATGNVNLTASTNLIFGGTTSLGESTSAVDSGAVLVGAFDEFANSSSTNVQAVLNDLDSVLTTALSGSSLWTDAGAYLYPNSGEVLGNSTSGGANKIAGLYFADSAPMTFGTDNDISFSFTSNTLGSTLTGGSRIGIGTTSALATLDIRSSLGTIPTASISGNTSQATLVVDQSGIGDLFAASKSGDTKFVISNAGNVGIGVASPTNKLEIGGSTSTISNAAGDITLDSASNNISFAGDSLINIQDTYLAGELGIGISDAVSKLHLHGAVTGKALAIFDELGDQDIFTASASGTTRFRLTNSGSLTLGGDYLNFGLTDGTTGYGVRDNGGVMEFKSISGAWTPMGAGGASWWDQTLGTLQPYNTTVDLLLGGTATSSAKIAFINMDSGTPTISLANQASNISIKDSTANALQILEGANSYLKITTTGAAENVSFGNTTTNPSYTYLGTGDATFGGYIIGQRFVDSSNVLAYLDPANATSLSIVGDIVNIDGTAEFKISSTTNQNIKIDAGSGTVIIGAAGAGKLDAGTVDPPYTINGEKFATYMAGMTGVKEETTGTIYASQYIPSLGYRATLDLATSPEGSDLWLFSQASNLKNNLDELVVLLASSRNTKTWYEIDALGGKLHLYSLAPTTISYRLTAPRYDASSWANTRDESSTSVGHVINDDSGWTVPPAIAALFEGTSPEPISPLASDSAIIIATPVVIAPTPSTDSIALFVDGELDAATISARTAILQNIQAETITAKNIVADTIEANHILGLDAKIASLSGMSDGQLETITDRIKARLAELTGNIPSAEDIPLPQEAIASQTPSGAEGEVGLTASSSATLASADIDFVTINNYLAVIGTATITTLDVTNGLYTDSISSKNGRLALLDGTMVVDSLGQVAINGDLTVSGKILADSAQLNSLSLGNPSSATPSALAHLLSVYNEQGETVATIDASGSANLASLTTNMITIASAKTATSSALAELLGTAESNATAGENILISPSTELTIKSPYVTSNSLIYLTPTGGTENKVLFVKSKNTCDKNNPELVEGSNCTPSFTVGIDLPASFDIPFNWWIIELAPPQNEDKL